MTLSYRSWIPSRKCGDSSRQAGTSQQHVVRRVERLSAQCSPDRAPVGTRGFDTATRPGSADCTFMCSIHFCPFLPPRPPRVDDRVLHLELSSALMALLYSAIWAFSHICIGSRLSSRSSPIGWVLKCSEFGLHCNQHPARHATTTHIGEDTMEVLKVHYNSKICAYVYITTAHFSHAIFLKFQALHSLRNDTARCPVP